MSRLFVDHNVLFVLSLFQNLLFSINDIGYVIPTCSSFGELAFAKRDLSNCEEYLNKKQDPSRKARDDRKKRISRYSGIPDAIA